MMDGFIRPGTTAGALGILYAEDFGADPTPPVPVPEPAPGITQAMLDDACTRAVAVAQAAWADDAGARRAQALAQVAAALSTIRQDAARHADQVADGIAQTALSMLSAALPHFCSTHGDAEVRALVARLAPLLGRTARLVIRVHSGLVDPLRTDLVALDEAIADQIEIRAANLPPGDVRVAWEDGGLVRDAAVIRAAMQEGLAALGLVEPPPPSLVTEPQMAPNRSFAHAQ